MKTQTRRAWIAGVIGGAAAVVPRRGAAEHRHQDSALPVPQDEGDVGTLHNPWAAGQTRARVVEGDNDPFIIAIENQIKCNCSCAHSLYACRTTDFNCQFWQPLHASVIAMAEQGNTAEEIIAAYAEEHGEEFLMAPPPRGFNIAGYALPGAVLSLVAATMVWVIRRRNEAGPVAVPVEADDGFSSEERDRLAEALKRFEG